jgi:hypothetical protein
MPEHDHEQSDPPDADAGNARDGDGLSPKPHWPDEELDQIVDVDIGSFEEMDDADDADVDENEDTEDDAYLDPFEAGVDPDAKGAVERWKIVVVGHRPEDHLARDSLYSALLHDHRATWFRRYLKRPSAWMEALVAHIGDKADRRRALLCVLLDYQHKLHLARQYPTLVGEYGDPDDYKFFPRVWRCAPYTVQVVRRNGGRLNIRGCGYPRLCPWCFARKVVEVSEVLRQGPLKNVAGKYLLLGKPNPFAEPFRGIDGQYDHADWLAYTQGETVRGHFARYYGRNPGRMRETKRALSHALLAAAKQLGAAGGLLTHQVGSALVTTSGQLTFLHDLGLVAELTAETAGSLRQDMGGATWVSTEAVGTTGISEITVRWRILPADEKSSLRVALAGRFGKASHGPAGASETSENEAQDDASIPRGMRGALSWQPTMFLDDQMWLPYVLEIRKQRLYEGFGTWRHSLAAVGNTMRRSISHRFKEVQAARHAQRRQQTGNSRRRRDANDRRADLLNAARSLWPQVLAASSSEEGRRGRPPLRDYLAERLRAQGITVSVRDLKWVMKQLGSPPGRT